MTTPTIADATITMIAHAFRLGHTGEANERLQKFVDELARVLPTLGSRAQPLLPPRPMLSPRLRRLCPPNGAG